MDIIKKVKKLCFCCMQEHEVDVVSIEAKTLFKGCVVNYKATSFYCSKTKEYFEDEEMVASNDIAMKDAYREANDLLKSSEIANIRKKYDITQKDLCLLLGWGEKTITRYESHQVQEKSNDLLLRQVFKRPEFFIECLNEHKGQLASETFVKYEAKARDHYKEQKDFYRRSNIMASYAPYGDLSSLNGNAVINFDKIIDVIRYFANSEKVKFLYKVKLMKMLWYADFIAFKKRACGITGLVYQAYPMGALPLEHEEIIRLKGINFQYEEGDFEAIHFLPTENKEYHFLAQDEVKILDRVIELFGRDKKDTIVSKMHKEKAFTETPKGELISYEYAKELTVF